MAETGVDFNDTFRVLAKVNASNAEAVVASILKLCAPQVLYDKKNAQNQYSPAQI